MNLSLALAPEIRFPHVYIHLPFCESICHYCDFYVARSREADHPRLFNAITADLGRHEPKLADKLDTIYFGGGTPSESPPELLLAFLEKIRPWTHSQTEIVMEANPTSITQSSVDIWKSAGINRLSIGVQSLQDPLLKKLSRLHSARDAIEAIEIARTAIPNINVDLIYGIPELETSNLREDAKTLASLGVKHVSAYTLTLEPKHFLYSRLPSSEETLQQSEAICEILGAHGLHYYEASNYAVPGFESRHNRAYWASRPYLALGPSAHGYDGASKRWKNIADWKRYSESLESNGTSIEWMEELSQGQRLSEYLITRLRTKMGLDFYDFQRIFGIDLLKSKISVFEQLEQAGLGSIQEGFWKPSFHGLMLADEVSLKLA